MSRRGPGGLRIGAVVLVAACFAGCSSKGPDVATSPTESVAPPDTTATEAGPTPLADASIRLVPVAELASPVAFASRAGTDDLYVAEQAGTVRRIEVGSADGDVTHRVAGDPVLDLTDTTRRRGEQGLLGLAFSPDGSWLYVDYTDRDGTSHVVGYRMDGDQADPTTARELLTVPQPYPNHNGGQLAFGQDGFLYIGLGDGGSAGDPGNRAQDPAELLGKILRIDPTPEAAQAYAIPEDNPFSTGGGAPEIWVLGVRNPWRFSFDTANGDLWVADVGQDTIEEIDWLPAGGGPAGRAVNLGWPYFEGTRPFRSDPVDGLVGPVHEYDHSQGCSITGGFVYRGSKVPALQGAYLYADYCTAQVRGLRIDGGAVVEDQSLGVSVAQNSLSSFGQDRHGELYVLSTEGTVYRVESA